MQPICTNKNKGHVGPEIAVSHGVMHIIVLVQKFPQTDLCSSYINC